VRQTCPVLGTSKVPGLRYERHATPKSVPLGRKLSCPKPTDGRLRSLSLRRMVSSSSSRSLQKYKPHSDDAPLQVLPVEASTLAVDHLDVSLTQVTQRVSVIEEQIQVLDGKLNICPPVDDGLRLRMGEVSQGLNSMRLEQDEVATKLASLAETCSRFEGQLASLRQCHIDVAVKLEESLADMRSRIEDSSNDQCLDTSEASVHELVASESWHRMSVEIASLRDRVADLEMVDATTSGVALLNSRVSDLEKETKNTLSRDSSSFSMRLSAIRAELVAVRREVCKTASSRAAVRDAVSQNDLVEIRSTVHDLANLSCEQGAQIDELSRSLAEVLPPSMQLLEPQGPVELESNRIFGDPPPPCHSRWHTDFVLPSPVRSDISSSCVRRGERRVNSPQRRATDNSPLRSDLSGSRRANAWGTTGFSTLPVGTFDSAPLSPASLSDRADSGSKWGPATSLGTIPLGTFEAVPLVPSPLAPSPSYRTTHDVKTDSPVSIYRTPRQLQRTQSSHA